MILRRRPGSSGPARSAAGPCGARRVLIRAGLLCAAVAAFGIASAATANADDNAPADGGLLGAVTATVGSTVTSVTNPLTARATPAGTAEATPQAKPHRPSDTTNGPAKITTQVKSSHANTASTGHAASQKAAPVSPDRKPGSLLTPVTEAVSQAVRPATGTVAKTVEPVTQRVTPVVTASAAPVTKTVTQAVSQPMAQLAEPAVSATASLTAPVAHLVEPVTTAAAPVLRPVTTVLEPVLAPVVQALEPVTAAVRPVTQIIAPIVEPVADAAAPVTDPSGGLVDPIVRPTDPATPPVDGQTGEDPGQSAVAPDDTAAGETRPAISAPPEPITGSPLASESAGTTEWWRTGAKAAADLPCATAAQPLTGWAARVAHERLNGAALVPDWGSNSDAPWSPERPLPSAPVCTATGCGSSVERPHPQQLPPGLLASAAPLHAPVRAQLATGYSADLSARAALVETRPG